MYQNFKLILDIKTFLQYRYKVFKIDMIINKYIDDQYDNINEIFNVFLKKEGDILM